MLLFLDPFQTPCPCSPTLLPSTIPPTDIEYEACNVLDSPVLREGIKIYSDWPTIPQLYIGGEFIGGADIISTMFTNGELHEALGLEKPAKDE